VAGGKCSCQKRGSLFLTLETGRAPIIGDTLNLQGFGQVNRRRYLLGEQHQFLAVWRLLRLYLVKYVSSRQHPGFLEVFCPAQGRDVTMQVGQLVVFKHCHIHQKLGEFLNLFYGQDFHALLLGWG
jgi:hypothetical protein